MGTASSTRASSTADGSRFLIVRANEGQSEEEKDNSCLSANKVKMDSADALDKTIASDKNNDANTKDKGTAVVPDTSGKGKHTNPVFQYPLTDAKELEKALKYLKLSPHELKLGAKIVKENPTLFHYFETAFKSIISMQEPSVDGCSFYLDQLNVEFFDMEGSSRTIVGDFLSHVKFGKVSFEKYKEILTALGVEYFTDKMTQEDKHSHQLLLLIASIRSHWWNFSDASLDFGLKLSSEGILEELVQDLVRLIGIDTKTLKFSYVFESAIGTLHNVAKVPNLRQTFRDLKIVDILGNFLTYEDLPKVTMLVLMVLSLIIDENQTGLLFSHESVFDLLLLLTGRAWKSADHRYDGFSLDELIVSLTGLSRNDQVKKLLVEKGSLTLVNDVLANGSEGEKELAAKWLWELSFDPDNKDKIKGYESLIQTIKDLSKSINRKIARSTQGALWVLGMDMNKKDNNKKKKKAMATEETVADSAGHIMISYNWADQKKLIQIRDVLQTQGYKLWMDIDNISGSTLQAMAEAVEQAEVVLICMSEKYKESSNCRSEAEYAFSLRKPIIPLLMQFDYKPDGWLGILLGTKIFFNFSGKYDFETKITELVKEIGHRGKLIRGIKNDDLDGPMIKEAVAPAGKAPGLEAAGIFDMSMWMTENNLQRFTFLQSLNKEHLQFLKKLSQRAPEFYYSYLRSLLAGKVKPESVDNLMVLTKAVEGLSR